MATLLSRTWSFLKGRPDHPLYRREMAGWAYLRLWRPIKQGCFPISTLLLATTTVCCMLPMAAAATQSPEEWYLIIFGLLMGLMAGGETLRWITGLAATALTATSISAEIEAETYELLRLTPLPPAEIVLAKFGAAFRQVRMPLAIVSVVRAVTIPGIVLWFGYFFLYTPQLQASQLSYSAPPSPLLPVFSELTPLILPILAGGAAVVLGFLYILIEPFTSTILYTALGVFASTLARSRSGGLLAAGGLRLLLAGLGYVAGNILSAVLQLLFVPVLLITPNIPPWLEYLLNEPGLLISGAAMLAILGLAITVAAQMGVTLLLLSLASRRAARLPFTA